MMINRVKNRPVLMIGLLVLTIEFCSCSATHIYQVGGPDGRVAGNQPATEWESKPAGSFFWGALRRDVQIENCVLGDGTRINIEEIKIEKNFGQILLSVITLGIWDPVKISWRCAKPKPTHP